VITYGALTSLAVGALWLSGAAGADAVLYGLTAVSTGGFAPHDGSLEALGGYGAQVMTTLACVAGAISLVTLRGVIRDGPRRLLRDPQLRLLVVLGILGSIACALSLHFGDGLPLWRAARTGPIMALSAERSRDELLLSTPANLAHPPTARLGGPSPSRRRA
jgi:trk system potassium uptake protein TrkH